MATLPSHDRLPSDPTISRRTFLGGSMAAAVGSLVAGPFGATARAQDAGRGFSLDYLKPTGALDEAYWQRVRQEFNIVDSMRYMNNGTLGPMPRPVFDANVRYLREIAEDPRTARIPDSVRERVAAFVGADPAEIVLTRSTTEGMKIFAAGLDLNEGDEVLMTTHEHPGGYGPWRAREQRHGIKIAEVAIPAPPESVDQVVGLVEKAMTPKTRVLIVSHPIFVTGLLMPIKELADMAHTRNVLVGVDGAHALGMIALDMHALGIDFYTTAGQKWLMAGTGTGVAYFKRDIQDQVWSDMWRANDTPEMGAEKYERSGQRDVPSARGMEDAVRFQDAIGKQNVEGRIRQLATRLKDGLADLPGVKLGTSSSPEMSGGLTTFYIEGVPNETTTKVVMEREGIYIVRSGLNPNACRVSTHIYNTFDEVDGVIAAVKYIAENRSQYSSSAA